VAMLFPGMDPCLEDPQIWSGVHASFIVYLRDQLQPMLRPRYIASVEERVFVEGPDRQVVPDVWVKKNRPRATQSAVAFADGDAPVIVKVPHLEIHESFVEILDRKSGQKVVTVIEAVSPTNKFSGPGRKSYLDKQGEVRASDAHLVEIDLLRFGPHVLAVPEWVVRGQGDYAYLACVNRAVGTREDFEFYARGLRDRLPRIHIPLAEGDPDVVLDVQAILEHTYEAGAYRDRLNYDASCRPPLSREDQEWANQLIQAARQAT
jgi:hypothetical protein